MLLRLPLPNTTDVRSMGVLRRLVDRRERFRDAARERFGSGSGRGSAAGRRGGENEQRRDREGGEESGEGRSGRIPGGIDEEMS